MGAWPVWLERALTAGAVDGADATPDLIAVRLA